MNQPLSTLDIEMAPSLIGPLAMLCWITSLFMPAMSAPEGWILGIEFVTTGVLAFPLAILFSPLLALAPFTNIIFLANLLRLWSPGTGHRKAPDAAWVGCAFVFNCVALAFGAVSKAPVLGDMGQYPAMWLWLLSFLLLAMAIMRPERGGKRSRGHRLKDRWTAAIAVACIVSLAALTMRVVKFPASSIDRTVSGVEGIEVQRSGVPPHQYPLLEDGYLRQSKYKFFVLDGRTQEFAPGLGWIARPGKRPVRNVVREDVESFSQGPRGPENVLRSSITILEDGKPIARKKIYQGMIEDGHGWVGAIALKFVQGVLQPAPKAYSDTDHRMDLVVAPIDLQHDTKQPSGKRRPIGCPSSVNLDSPDLRELRTPQWSLYALNNITGAVCSADSILVVMGNSSAILLDVLSLEGHPITRARALTTRSANYYAIEEVDASDGTWRLILAGYLYGRSINEPPRMIERFEIALKARR